MLRIAADTGGTFTDILVCKEGRLSASKVRGRTEQSSALIDWLANTNEPSYKLLHGTTVATNAILENKMPGSAFVCDPGFEDILTIGRQAREELYAFEPRRERLVPSEGVQNSIAVCLINGFEREAEEGRLAKGKFVSLSSQIDPNIRELERASTTWLNARLMPVIADYLEAIESASKGEVFVMSSSGGLVSVNSCLKSPISTVMSGPAAGVVAAEWLARKLGVNRVIAFDMGGTSTDVTLIDGKAIRDDSGSIRSSPIRTPRVAVHTIGCGGGSIAWIDAGGALRVGPQSAGAQPGPAFLGGSEFTVSDANLILGRLPMEPFHERNDKLFPGASRTAAEKLGKRLGISVEEVAQAVVEIANGSMAAAVRKVSSQMGFDPSDFALMAYGGGAGLHACPIAASLGIENVIIPRLPGLFSAFGLLLAPHVLESRRAVNEDWNSEMEAECRKLEEQVAWDSFITKRHLAMRYKGQSHEILVPLETSDTTSDVNRRFELEHRAKFGFVHEGREVMAVSFSVRLEKLSPEENFEYEVNPVGTGPGFISRNEIGPEAIPGPLLVSQSDSTLWVPAEWTVSAGGESSLLLRRY